MKQLYISLVFLISLINLHAEISVKSFRKLETDLDARVNYPLKDQNGDPCAIIKVETDQTGFYFDAGQLGVIKTEQKHGEIWVYVPYGLKRITISHDKLGFLRDYLITIPIEKATVYELVLISGKVLVTVDETIDSQWLIINPTPGDAAVYINDEYKQNGTYTAKVKPGKYTYRVEAPLYHTDAGMVEVTDAKKSVDISLKPAFGYIQIQTLPESGAKVIVDDKTLNQVSPVKTDAIASGEHTVRVMKDMFVPVTQKVTVTDGQTVPLNLTLPPNFAELSITAPAGSTLFINNAAKGSGTWQGRLGAGVYSLEARMDKYSPARQDIELVVGDKKDISLQPTPIYGSLDVMSKPIGVTITINGKEYGTTPNTINKLLIGDYTVQLSKAGYASVSRNITITEGRSSEVNETLSNGRTVSITSSPAVAELYIDNQRVGTTPYTGSLTFGTHYLRVEQNGKRTEKTVSISPGGGSTDFKLSISNLKSGLVAYYPFNGDTNDKSGYGNNGIVNGNLLYSDNKAYMQQGNYISIPNNNSLNYMSEMTISMYSKPTRFDLGSWNDTEMLVGKGYDNTSDGYAIMIKRNSNPNDASANSFNNVSYQFRYKDKEVSSGYLPVNKDYIITGVYKNNTIYIYVNGQLMNQQIVNMNSYAGNNYPLYVNHHTWGAGNGSSRYEGYISDLRIWNRALSDSEISEISNE